MPKSKDYTDQEWTFAYLYVHKYNKIEAYRRAYPKEAHRSIAQIAWAADKLLKRVQIVNVIEELRQEARTAGKLTATQHMNILADLRDKAVEADQLGPAIRAEELRGKAAGLYVQELIVHKGDDMKGLEQIKERMDAILEQNPVLKRVFVDSTAKRLLPPVDQASPVPSGKAADPMEAEDDL